jgi:hypothetical protein
VNLHTDHQQCWEAPVCRNRHHSMAETALAAAAAAALHVSYVPVLASHLLYYQHNTSRNPVDAIDAPPVEGCEQNKNKPLWHLSCQT